MDSSGYSHEDCNCEDDQGVDLCYVEGTQVDQDVSYDSSQISSRVWNSFRPPAHFGLIGPKVTARKLDVTRAHLTGRMKVPRSRPQQSKVAYCVRCKDTEM